MIVLKKTYVPFSQVTVFSKVLPALYVNQTLAKTILADRLLVQ